MCAKVASSNYTASGTNFSVPGADGDTFDRTDISTLGQAVEEHTHASTRGLGVGRVQTSATPAATGEVQVATDKLKFYDGTAVRTLYGNNNPAAKVYNSSVQTIANSSITALSWDSEEFDTDTIHAGGSPTRLTATTAGIYLITAIAMFTSGGVSGRFQMYLRKNGVATNLATDSNPSADSNGSLKITALLELAATDYVEAYIWQNTGSSLNVDSAVGISHFSMCKVG